jgi:hypothetical protein
MATLREFKCQAHGEFSNRTGRCPHGCSKRFVRQEFRTAPAVHGGTAKFIDGHLNDLSRTYGMTDIASARTGESIMGQLARGKSAKEIDGRSRWGMVDVPHAPAGWTQVEGAKPSDAPRFHSPYPGVPLTREFREAAYGGGRMQEMTTIVGRVKGDA